MKEELLAASREFKTSFLDKYPSVEKPSELMATFIRVLNESEPDLPDCGEAINAVSVLLNNSNLRQFAEADFDENVLHTNLIREREQTGEYLAEELAEDSGSASSDTSVIVHEADEVVNGDGENLAGLNESVTKLIQCLE